MPREALTSTTSPSRRRERRWSRAASASATIVTRDGSRPAASAVGDGRGALTDDDEAVHDRRGRLAHRRDGRPRGSPRVPASRRGPRSGGRAGRPAPRGRRRRIRATRCTCRRSGSGRRRATTWTRCGADQPSCSPAAISARSGRPRSRRPPPPARCGPRAGPASGSRPAATRAAIRRVKVMPSRPADRIGLGADVGVVGEAVGQAARAAVRSPIRRDDRDRPR